MKAGSSPERPVCTYNTTPSLPHISPAHFSSSHDDCKRRITQVKTPHVGNSMSEKILGIALPNRPTQLGAFPPFLPEDGKIQLSKRCVYFGPLLKHWTIDDVHKISKPLWITPSPDRQGKQSRSSVGTSAFITTQRCHCHARGVKVGKTVHVYNWASRHEDMNGTGGVVLHIVELGTICNTENSFTFRQLYIRQQESPVRIGKEAVGIGAGLVVWRRNTQQKSHAAGSSSADQRLDSSWHRGRYYRQTDGQAQQVKDQNASTERATALHNLMAEAANTFQPPAGFTISLTKLKLLIAPKTKLGVLKGAQYLHKRQHKTCTFVTSHLYLVISL
jgi:hypothetical protein